MCASRRSMWRAGRWPAAGWAAFSGDTGKSPRIERARDVCPAEQTDWLERFTDPPAIAVDNGVVRIGATGVRAMKTILSVLIALSVLAGIAGSANALDTKSFFEQQDRQSY
jgi:hypothetical protein